VLVEALCHEQEAPGFVAQCVDGATTRLFTVTLTHTFVFWILGFGYVRSYASEHEPVKVEAEDRSGLSPDPITVGRLESHAEECRELKEAAERSCFREIMGALLEPPVVMNAVALGVALSPPLKQLFYSPGALFSFISSALSVVGKASPAVTSLITGGSLGLQLLNVRREDPLGLQALGLSGKAMVGMLFGRLVLVPILDVLVLLLSLDLLPKDPWSLLILFFQPAGVSANMITVLAQLMDQPQGAQMIALSSIPQILLYLPMATMFISWGMISSQPESGH